MTISFEFRVGFHWIGTDVVAPGPKLFMQFFYHEWLIVDQVVRFRDVISKVEE